MRLFTEIECLTGQGRDDLADLKGVVEKGSDPETYFLALEMIFIKIDEEVRKNNS